MNRVPEEFFNEINDKMDEWQVKIEEYEKQATSKRAMDEVRGLKSFISSYHDFCADMKNLYEDE